MASSDYSPCYSLTTCAKKSDREPEPPDTKHRWCLYTSRNPSPAKQRQNKLPQLGPISRTEFERESPRIGRRGLTGGRLPLPEQETHLGSSGPRGRPGFRLERFVGRSPSENSIGSVVGSSPLREAGGVMIGSPSFLSPPSAFLPCCVANASCWSSSDAKLKKKTKEDMLLGFLGREKVIMGHQQEARWPKVGPISNYSYGPNKNSVLPHR